MKCFTLATFFAVSEEAFYIRVFSRFCSLDRRQTANIQCFLSATNSSIHRRAIVTAGTVVVLGQSIITTFLVLSVDFECAKRDSTNANFLARVFAAVGYAVKFGIKAVEISVTSMEQRLIAFARQVIEIPAFNWLISTAMVKLEKTVWRGCET